MFSKKQQSKIAHIVSTNEEKTIITRIGFGITDRGLPYRILAYLLPAIEVLRNHPNTKLEAYVATNGARYANPEFDSRRVDIFSSQLRSFIVAYLGFAWNKKIFGGFYRDNRTEVLGDNDLITRRPDLIQILTSTLISRAEQPLVDFCERRGGQRAWEYMAAHTLYAMDPIDLKGFMGEVGTSLIVESSWSRRDDLKNANRITFGGGAEEIFFQARKTLMRAMGCHSNWQTQQVFTQVGKRPTYIPLEGEPILTKEPADLEIDAQNLFGKLYEIPSVMKRIAIADICLLLMHLGSCELFQYQVAEEMADEFIRTRKLPKQEILQKGLGILLELWIGKPENSFTQPRRDSGGGNYSPMVSAEELKLMQSPGWNSSF